MDLLRRRGFHLTDEGFKQCIETAKCTRSDTTRIEAAALNVSCASTMFVATLGITDALISQIDLRSIGASVLDGLLKEQTRKQVQL